MEKEIDALRLGKLTASLGEHKTILSSSQRIENDMFRFKNSFSYKDFRISGSWGNKGSTIE